MSTREVNLGHIVNELKIEKYRIDPWMRVVVFQNIVSPDNK